MVVSKAIQTVAVMPREEFNMSTLNGVTLKVTCAMDLKAGPDKRLKVDHGRMRSYIMPPDLDLSSNETLYIIEGLEDGAKPFAISKCGKFYVSNDTLDKLSVGSEDMRYGVFLNKLHDVYDLWLVAGKPPVGASKSHSTASLKEAIMAFQALWV